VKAKEQARADKFRATLLDYAAKVRALPGITPAGHIDSLVGQLIESRRRIEFAHHVRDGNHSTNRMDPNSPIFDPLRAAVLHYRSGNLDEAWWLVFLATHFGKHAEDGWLLTRNVYGRLGGPGRWDWVAISEDPMAFRTWLAQNQGNIPGRFSNHRKYESLRADSDKGTWATFQSYVDWVGPPEDHRAKIVNTHKRAGQEPEAAFEHLYWDLDDVFRFGRLAKFDFLTMLGKLGIAPIDAGSAFLRDGATGPLRGARLLFDGDPKSKTTARVLDDRLAELDGYLQVGMQALEDSICNWQKSPAKFVSFKG
jgi:Alpha-glutamyl/putrescinyl thymine pyrophosphorylase clade 3